MQTVTHREMRNQSGEILRRIESGESVQVSNNGRVVAVISPAHGSELDRLIATGGARPAATGIETLLGIERVTSPVSTREVLDDVRRPW